MLKVNFCYEISEKARMAHTQDGDNAKAYIKASVDVKKPFHVEDHQRMHEVLMLENIANTTGIEKEFFKPISYEEYLQNADDDE